MLKNLFLTSIRALLKNKSTFFLNLLALTIGMAACIIAYLHIQDELSYDRYHEKESRIFRVVTGDIPAGSGWVKVASPIPPKIKAELPEVVEYARLTKFSYNEKVAVAYEEAVYNEEHVFLADPSFYSIFDLELLKGSFPENPPRNTIFISSSTAAKYFLKEEPIGKVITIDGRMDFEVVGVYEDIPANTHYEIDFIVPFENLEDAKPNTSLRGNWGQFNYFAYVLLDENADASVVDSKVKQIVAEYGDGETLKFENLGLQSLADIHFQENRGNLKPAYNSRYLIIYSSVAVAILLISFINFVNLNVASSTKRIKEVGVRKVLGASKGQLTSQFVAESILTAIIASLLAFLLTDLSLPYINNVLQSSMSANFLDIMLIAGVISLILIIALFSGLYISLYILSFNPVNAVKGVIKVGDKGKRFKESLMIIQFTVSCVLILSSIFIYRQLTFLINHDIGLDQEGVINLQLFNKEAQKEVGVLVPEFEKISGIESISASRFTPGLTNWHQTVQWEGQENDISWNLIMVDKYFVSTYDIELVEGDIETIQELADNTKFSYILNEAAVREAGWENALGKSISPFGRNGYAQVVGVAKDFNYKSLHTTVEPCILVINSEANNYSQISIEYSTGDISGLLSDIESIFVQVVPDTPFEYSFANNQFGRLYQVERQTSQLIGLLTIVAIILALLGVYALLSFTIKERTKEIAIRKVLGIRLKGTIYLLSGNYIKLLLIANAIGIPIAWYVMDLWLQNFSYQDPLGVFAFIGVALLTLLLILIVVGAKVVQIEKINPTDALRYE